MLAGTSSAAQQKASDTLANLDYTRCMKKPDEIASVPDGRVNNPDPGHAKAKTALDVRQENLRSLIQRFGGIQADAEHLAALAHCNPEHLRQIARGTRRAGTPRVRGLGHAVARRIERGIGLPIGWMDLSHDSLTGWRQVMAQLPDAIGEPLSEVAEAVTSGAITPAEFDLLVNLVRRTMGHDHDQP